MYARERARFCLTRRMQIRKHDAEKDERVAGKEEGRTETRVVVAVRKQARRGCGCRRERGR